MPVRQGRHLGGIAADCNPLRCGKMTAL
jgi:hypothetical protein